MKKVFYYNRKDTSLLFIACTLFFGIPPILMFLWHDFTKFYIYMIFATFIFIAILLIFFRLIMSFFRPILVLDERGVWYFNRFISSWDNIDFIQFSRIKNKKRAKEIINSIPGGTSTIDDTALRVSSSFFFIVIFLKNYDEYYNKLNYINKFIFNENKELTGSGINLNPMEIKASSQEIVDAFKQFNCKIL